MVLPISCNECRRRKIRCDRVQPCTNCTQKSISCTYPSKFRSIELNKIKPNEESSVSLEYYKAKVKELETRLAVSEDLISIFDSTGNSCDKYFGGNSITSLESEMMRGILPFEKDATRAINLKKKDLPVLVPDDPPKNKKIIISLVKFFFKEDQYYYFNEMVDKDDLFNFLENYENITKWKNDEDIMLICCILIDVLKNCLDHREEPIIINQEQKIKNLITYYFQISKIQIKESKKFMQSQLILINYYYFVYAFEKCWKLIFQLVSNAYSIGLHIEGGQLWTKINTMEALMCSSSSRPNIINSCALNDPKLCEEIDEVKEFKLCEILRAKNSLFVSSYVHKTVLDYQDILKLDIMYEEYEDFLLSNIAMKKYNDIETSKRNEKIYIFLLMSFSTHLKLHFNYFEIEKFSNDKVMILITKYIDILDNFVYGRLNTLRDKFSSLECFFYQVLLIFLKYLNFKSVSSMLGVSGINAKPVKNEELDKLEVLQSRLISIVGKNSLVNNRVQKVMEIIKSVDLGKMKPENFVSGNKTGGTHDNYYITDEFKSLLEDPVYDVLKSVTDFPNGSNSFYEKFSFL